MGEECWEIKKKNCANNLRGGGDFWETLEKKIGGGIFDNFLGGPSLKRGTRILILSLHVPPPPQIQNWPGTSGGFSHGARSPTPTAGMAIPAVGVGGGGGETST